MDAFQKEFFSILKSSLTDKKAVVNSKFDWENALETAKSHGVQVLLYYGIKKSNLIVPPEIMGFLEKVVYVLVRKSATQDYEAKKIYADFNENKIKYMPLKGDVIKKLYPNIEMRYMGDVDVFIDTEQYSMIKNIVKKNGYDEICESDHEYIWAKNECLTLEMHKRLVPSYNKDFYSYYYDGWSRAINVSGTEYVLSDEDLYIYIFTHLAKHYRDGGIGIKHFVDIYVFLNSKLNLDMDYITNELKKMNLDIFHQNVLNTIDVWFNDKAEDDMSDFISNKVFSSGAYGTKYNKLMADALKNAKKLKSTKKVRWICAINYIFPSYSNMCKRNDMLKYFPFLLPFAWVVRWINILLFKGRLVKRKVVEVHNTSDKNIQKYHYDLKYVGLDFNFKE